MSENGKRSTSEEDDEDEKASNVSVFGTNPDDSEIENEELIHERMHKQRRKNKAFHLSPHEHHHHHHHQPHHRKEYIKPDPPLNDLLHPLRPPEASVATEAQEQGRERRNSYPNRSQSQPQARPQEQAQQKPAVQEQELVATAVDEEQLHKRLVQSESRKKLVKRLVSTVVGGGVQAEKGGGKNKKRSCSSSSRHDGHQCGCSTSSRSSSSGSTAAGKDPVERSKKKSPPIPHMKIIIPPSVANSLSKEKTASSTSVKLDKIGMAGAVEHSGSHSVITKEKLDYGPLLKPNEVQVLYRSPEPPSTDIDRHLKEEEAKKVAPHLKQSPISIMSINPAYHELQNKPLCFQYPATVENLRLNNTGFSWEVKLPYQISMIASISGAHLQSNSYYRLDQFHCHWGRNDQAGSEHTVDNRPYSAELHFVHYNMDKYHTLSKAARRPDGLVVVAVFLDAQEDHHNHAELEKICLHLKSVQLKGEHSIIRQAVRIENLLPLNRSYWSYQGSLTTPPFLESVTWFIMKHPIKCSANQLKRFRSLKSTLRHEPDTRDEEADDPEAESNSVFIKSNFRTTQPLNGRTIVSYDE